MTVGMGYIGVKTGLFRAMGGKGGMRAEDIARENQVGGTTRPVTSATKLRATEFAETDGLESPSSLQIFQSTALALRCHIARN